MFMTSIHLDHQPTLTAPLNPKSTSSHQIKRHFEFNICHFFFRSTFSISWGSLCILESILLTLINLTSQRGHTKSLLILHHLGSFTSWYVFPSSLLYGSIWLHRRPVFCSIALLLSQFTSVLPRGGYIFRLLLFWKCCGYVRGNMYRRSWPLSVA